MYFSLFEHMLDMSHVVFNSFLDFLSNAIACVYTLQRFYTGALLNSVGDIIASCFHLAKYILPVSTNLQGSFPPFEFELMDVRSNSFA